MVSIFFHSTKRRRALQTILDLVRSGTFEIDFLEKMNTKEINATVGNEAQLVKVLADCYREFCSNTIFGMASYLGRRIRHGTLRGTLLQDLDGSVNEYFPDLMGAELFSEYFKYWKDNFDRYIKRIGSDYFHIRSLQKPKGMINPEITDGAKLAILKIGAKNIVNSYEEHDDPDYFVGIICENCWQIAGVDMVAAHVIISACKAQSRVTAIPDNVKNSINRPTNDYIRHINEHMEERFNTVINWFDRPKITVPSVDLPTLIRVVNTEVREEFPDYVEPNLDEKEIAIILSGVSYHIVYDFLYVTLKNAAQHGMNGGDVELKISKTLQDSLIKKLVIEVRSRYESGDDYMSAKARVNDCGLEALESAYVEENKSGLRKIMRLERDWAEITNVNIDTNVDFFTGLCS